MSQIKSKERVTKHGEVFTAPREVNAMLDLVKDETERIESRFLEPACGTGNFLVEVLRRKLRVVGAKYGHDTLDYEYYAIKALSTLYGIDILEDNVYECRKRLFEIFVDFHDKHVNMMFISPVRNVARYILEKNICWGDALTMHIPNSDQPIVFTEWTFPKKHYIKGKEYVFSLLVDKSKQLALFNDMNEPAYIPESRGEQQMVFFLNLGNESAH